MDKIDVYALARAGTVLAGELPLASMPRLAASLVRADGTLAYRAAGEIDPLARPALRLALKALLPLACDRCGRPLEFQLDVERLFFFVQTQAELAAIAIDDSPEEALLGSTQFDLAGLIEDEAILQLPISPRHEGCHVEFAGAAPGGPMDERPQRPFAALEQLRGRVRRRTAPAAEAREPLRGRRGRRGGA